MDALRKRRLQLAEEEVHESYRELVRSKRKKGDRSKGFETDEICKHVLLSIAGDYDYSQLQERASVSTSTMTNIAANINAKVLLAVAV